MLQIIYQPLHVHTNPHILKSLCGFIFSIAEWIFLTLQKMPPLSGLTSWPPEVGPGNTSTFHDDLICCNVGICCGEAHVMFFPYTACPRCLCLFTLPPYTVFLFIPSFFPLHFFPISFSVLVSSCCLFYLSHSSNYELQCRPAHGFIHVLPITDNMTEFKHVIQQQRISANMDTPEGGFDAMLQAAVCQVNNEAWASDVQSVLPRWPERSVRSGASLSLTLSPALSLFKHATVQHRLKALTVNIWVVVLLSLRFWFKLEVYIWTGNEAV